MTTKPDDIPKWALDTANDHLERGKYESMTIVLARAILKAKNDAYEEAAEHMRTLRSNRERLKLHLGEMTQQEMRTLMDGLHLASQAIRNLKHKTEV